MTVKECADALGITTEEFFQQAYERYGLLYSIGGPKETHARFVKRGDIPLYAAKYVKVIEKTLARPVGSA